MDVGGLLIKSATIHPNKIALSFGDKSETYSRLNERANDLANVLNALNVKRQHRVAILMNNCPQLIESLFACFKGGYIAVPINSRLHPKEISYILQHSGSTVIFLGEVFRASIESIKGDIGLVRHFICTSSSSDGVLGYEELITKAQKRELNRESKLEDLAWLFYTSGTTGKPKGASLTHRNLLVMTMDFLTDVYPASYRDIALHAAPLTHGSGLYMLPLLARGSTNIIMKSKGFDARSLFEMVEKEKVTILPFLAPTMIKMLLTSPQLLHFNLRSLRCIVYGGSPMYVEDLKGALTHFGQILAQIYGQGEAPMSISHLSRDEHILKGSDEELKRLSSAGIPMTDVEVKIFDESDKKLPHGEVGEIVVKGDIVMEGYWRDPAATAETIRNGWLHTGDLGYADDRGYIYITGRKKDMIISGGANIYPREVEEIILRHPNVLEVAVIGIPDPLWGESVKAIVVPKEGARVSEEDIIEFCKQHIASYKKPNSVDFVESLPKNAYGKVLKLELRERFAVKEKNKGSV